MLMVGLDGLEPSTSVLSGLRSNQLSYRPLNKQKDYRIPPVKPNQNPLLQSAISLIHQRHFDPAHKGRNQVVQKRKKGRYGGEDDDVANPNDC